MTLRVLAVEDSPTQAAALLAALEGGGYAVTEARTGEAALAAVESTTFDVVISDIVMPGAVDGYELCRRLKHDRPALPVILLTSLSDPLDIIRGLEAGADNFLTKPYTDALLLERLEVLLATRRTRLNSRVQAGVSVRFMDRQFVITSEREQILDLLVTTFEDAVRQNRELRLREEEIAHSRERLARMYDVAVLLNHATTEQAVVDTALDGVTRLPRVSAAWIALRDGAAGFRVAGARHLPPELDAPGALEGECLCRRMALAGELVGVTNIVECERIARMPASTDGPRFHACVPLTCGDQNLGVMNLLGEDEGLFDDDDRTILYGIGSQVGFAIERARTWHRLEERVDERARELRDSEERYRTLVTEVNDGFFVTDAEGVITFANPAMARIHGVDGPGQLEGRHFESFLPEGVREAQSARFRASVAEGTLPSLVTTPILRPDGSQAIVEIRSTAVMRDGQVIGTRGVLRDVTERVRAEEALRLSDSILQRIGDLVLVSDGEGLITYVSPSVEAMLGYTPSEVLGDGWWALAWEDQQGARDERAAQAGRARMRDLPDSVPMEREVRAQDGATHWILWKETKGPGDLIIGVGHDVTEHRRLQEQFLQAQKMEAVGRLAGGIAHDFNNVLTSILITTEFLMAELTDDDGKRADVQAIREAAERAAALTQQLLAFSRKQVLQPRVVSLNDLVTGIEGMLRSLLGEDISIEALLAPDLGNVEMDPVKMEQVIMNLALNARDALPRGGRLLLETRNVDLNREYVQSHSEARTGPHVVLSVTDNGTGMDAAVAEHIFEPFFTTKGVGQGTGLGLATVHGIVNQSGGHIWVYSEPGHGTTFKVYLPRVSAKADPPTPRGAGRVEDVATGTLLLVEDDGPVRRAAERVLSRAGYDVIAVAGGAEALDAMEVREGSVDLLITDVVMPGMTGPELAERLHRSAPGLRVLFVSGYTDEVIARQGLVGPGHQYLEKPFVVDTLLARVREILDQPTAPAPRGTDSEVE